MHGHLNTLPGMKASFFVTGPGIPARRPSGEIDMRDVAPTLAAILGVSLPAVEGRNLLSPIPVLLESFARALTPPIASNLCAHGRT
jgi:hypothetical protein